jgi:predicted O-methyltransferase YrrM
MVWRQRVIKIPLLNEVTRPEVPAQTQHQQNWRGPSTLRLRWEVFVCRRKSDTRTQFLLELARAVVATPRSADPPPFLEIGTRSGGSALLMLRLLKVIYAPPVRRPLVLTVDPYGSLPYAGAPFEYDARHYRAMKQALAGYANHIHYMMDSELFLRLLDQMYLWRGSSKLHFNQFSLVYLDGSHDPTVVWAEIEHLLPRIIPGGFLIVDDTDWFDQAIRHQLEAEAPRLPITLRHHGKQTIITVDPGPPQGIAVT